MIRRWVDGGPWLLRWTLHFDCGVGSRCEYSHEIVPVAYNSSVQCMCVWQCNCWHSMPLAQLHQPAHLHEKNYLLEHTQLFIHALSSMRYHTLHSHSLVKGLPGVVLWSMRPVVRRPHMLLRPFHDMHAVAVPRDGGRVLR